MRFFVHEYIQEKLQLYYDIIVSLPKSNQNLIWNNIIFVLKYQDKTSKRYPINPQRILEDFLSNKIMA